MRLAGAALLASLALGCRHAAPVPADTLAALARRPGAHLAGEVTSLAPAAVLNRTDFVWTLEFSPDGSRVAFTQLGAQAYALGLWALGPPPTRLAEPRLNLLEWDVEALAFSPDGAHVAVASRDATVRLYDAATGALEATHTAAEPLVSVAFHPGGQALAVGGTGGLISVLSLPALTPVAQVHGHADVVSALAFEPSSGTLISGSWDRRIIAWSLSDGLAELRAFTFPWHVNDLTLDARGRRLGVAFSQGKAERTRDLYQREKRGEVEPAQDGNAAAVVDALTGKLLGTWHPHAGVVASAAISPDGRSLASGGWDKRVVVTDTAGKGEPVELRDFGWSVRRVRFSRDGRHLGVAAWTPQNPVGDHESDPSAAVYRVGYQDAKVE